MSSAFLGAVGGGEALRDVDEHSGLIAEDLEVPAEHSAGLAAQVDPHGEEEHPEGDDDEREIDHSAPTIG